MNVAILTNFRSHEDGYSLTHVVNAEAEMLSRHGHNVTIFTFDIYRPERGYDSVYPRTLCACLPDFEPINYESIKDLSDEHEEIAQKMAGLLSEKLKGFDLIFTHDWILTGHNLPLAEALRLCRDSLKHIPFYDWVHSVPAFLADWWVLSRYGPNHTLVYPNDMDRPFVADTFHTELARTLPIIPITDIRLFNEWTDEAWGVVDLMSNLLSASFVQVYPAAADKLAQKGLPQLIKVFASLKRAGYSVGLYIVDSWNGRTEKEDRAKFVKMADGCGLYGSEFKFWGDMEDNGKPYCMNRATLRNLMGLSNLFVFPSFSESYGLPVFETLCAGGVLPVFNRSMSHQVEVAGTNGLYFEFGSQERHFKPKHERDYYDWIAGQIIQAARSDYTLKSRTFTRQFKNMDYVYKEHYAPLIAQCRKAA